MVNLVQSKDRTRKQWTILGQHHGQACIARLLRSDPLPVEQHDSFIYCVVLGLAYEQSRCGFAPEAAYWAGYIDTLLLYATKQQKVA